MQNGAKHKKKANKRAEAKTNHMRLTSADVTKSSSSIRTAGTSRCGVHLLCLRTDKPVLDIFGIAGKKEKKNLFCKEIENH